MGLYINLLTLGPASELFICKWLKSTSFNHSLQARHRAKKTFPWLIVRKGTSQTGFVKNAVPLELKEPDLHCLHENNELS